MAKTGNGVLRIPFRTGKRKVEVMVEDDRFKDVFGVAQSDWK